MNWSAAGGGQPPQEEEIMTWFDVYLFTRLDNINFFFVMICMLSIVIGCITVLGEKMVKRGWIWFAAIALISGVLSCLIPTTKEAAAIYLIPKLANNEQVHAIPENALKLLNLKFQAWIEEMEPARKK